MKNLLFHEKCLSIRLGILSSMYFLMIKYDVQLFVMT